MAQIAELQSKLSDATALKQQMLEADASADISAVDAQIANLNKAIAKLENAAAKAVKLETEPKADAKADSKSKGDSKPKADSKPKVEATEDVFDAAAVAKNMNTLYEATVAARVAATPARDALTTLESKMTNEIAVLIAAEMSSQKVVATFKKYIIGETEGVTTAMKTMFDGFINDAKKSANKMVEDFGIEKLIVGKNINTEYYPEKFFTTFREKRSADDVTTIKRHETMKLRHTENIANWVGRLTVSQLAEVMPLLIVAEGDLVKRELITMLPFLQAVVVDAPSTTRRRGGGTNDLVSRKGVRVTFHHEGKSSTPVDIIAPMSEDKSMNTVTAFSFTGGTRLVIPQLTALAQSAWELRKPEEKLFKELDGGASSFHCYLRGSTTTISKNPFEVSGGKIHFDHQNTRKGLPGNPNTSYVGGHFKNQHVAAIASIFGVTWTFESIE